MSEEKREDVLPIIEHDITSKAKRVMTVDSSGNFASPGGVAISGATVLSRYSFHDQDVAGTTTYIGSTDDSGNWLIKKLDESASPDLDMTYANVSNNGSYTTYTDAWTNRASLTYQDLSNLTFTNAGSASIYLAAGTNDIGKVHIVDTDGTDINRGGSHYAVSADITSLANGGSAYLLGITDGTKTTYFENFNLHSDAGNISIQFFESGTVSANGTGLTPYDQDRIAATTATLAVYASPTVTGDGTKLIKHLITDTGDKKTGGVETMPEAWKLKKSTNYLIKITNNSGSAANLTGNFYWREE